MSDVPLFEITTIDNPETKIRDDGFTVDVKTGVVTLVFYAPVLHGDIFQFLQHGIKGYGNGLLSVRQKIKVREKSINGLSFDSSKVFAVRLVPPYAQATLFLAEARIKRVLTYQEANIITLNGGDDSLTVFAKACSMEDVKKQKISVGRSVVTAIEIFNNAAMQVFQNAGVAYLGRCENGLLLISEGRCVVNRPARDMVALTNGLQLAHFLETGHPRFSGDNLLKMVKGGR